MPKKFKARFKTLVLDIHKDLDVPVAIDVARMGQNGLCISRKRLLELEKTETLKALKAKKDCRVLLGVENPASPQQVRTAFEKLGIHTGMNTETGVMSTSEEALLNLLDVAPHAKVYVEPLLRYRETVKQIGTYINGIANRTFRDPDTGFDLMRGNFIFPGTVTWRLSCKGSPHLTFPRMDTSSVRTAVVSRWGDEGRVVKADYGQLELRVLASLSEDPAMLDIYKNGLDIHSNTSEALSVPRHIAKNVNFGIVYGMSANRLRSQLRQQGVGSTYEECLAWVEGWRETYSTAWAFMQALQEQAVYRGEVQAPDYGGVRKFQAMSGKRDDEVAREGANFPVQYLAAMLTHKARLKFSEKTRHRRSLVVNSPHDEVVVDVYGDGVEEAEVLRDSMLEEGRRAFWMRVPVVADVGVGPNWGECSPL